MIYDNWKLETPPTMGLLMECNVCHELYDTAESQAEEFERYCSVSCEHLDQQDPADEQQYCDNQDK